MKKQLVKFVLPALAAAVILQGCRAGGEDPGVEYAPDMYVSKGYEPMTQVAEKSYQVQTVSGRTVALSEDGKTMRTPVRGTIPYDLDFVMGHTVLNNFLEMQYPYANTIGGRDSANRMLKNPLPLTKEALENGKVLFNRTCAPCHGLDGQATGPVAAKIAGIPPYKSGRILNLSDGGMYHSITYGINNMGSYASVLTPQQRWEVIHYVNYLKNN